MKRPLFYALPLALFLGLAFFFWRGLSIDPRQLPSPLINQSVPQFELPHLFSGQPAFSDKDLRGHVALVNVFASWCEACGLEQAELVKIARSNAVKIYGIDYKDQRALAKRWLLSAGNPYASIGFDADGKVSMEWGVYGVPETFVVDANGIIRYKLIGPMTEATWYNVILPIVTRWNTP
jgi:cytochrome c biogenesis protein CcmG/thiol:disulfide interchange protein DsbE